MEEPGYEPRKHEGTSADSDEALYQSFLMPVREAMEKLGTGVMAEVVRRGLEGICRRVEEGS